MTLSEATDAVGRLISRYPNGGQGAGRGYIGGLSAVLLEYPRSIALRCDDPLRGVPRDVKFLPTPSDLIAWCERETEDLRRPVDREDRDVKMRAELERRIAEDQALEHDRATRPTLSELQEKHGLNWGINAADPINPQARENARTALDRANRSLLERENAAAGMDPGSNVSAALVKVLREKGVIPRHAEAAE
jgi:hypothetical protein